MLLSVPGFHIIYDYNEVI